MDLTLDPASPVEGTDGPLRLCRQGAAYQAAQLSASGSFRGWSRTPRN